MHDVQIAGVVSRGSQPVVLLQRDLGGLLQWGSFPQQESVFFIPHVGKHEGWDVIVERVDNDMECTSYPPPCSPRVSFVNQGTDEKI